jgi:DNA polymerase-3 subunit delta
MSMALEKLLSGLKKGIIGQYYLLYGDEEYLIDETLRQVVNLIIAPEDRDFGLFDLDGANIEIENLIDYILTPSLLGTRKVIIVRNTTIFNSNENLSDLIIKIQDNIDNNPAKAAKYFLTFLNLAGFAQEDLQQNGWRRISDEHWNKIINGNIGEDREKWLPRILEICSSLGLSEVAGMDKTEKLEEIFQSEIPAENCLIFTAETVDKRKKIYKNFTQHGVVIPFFRARKESGRKEVLQNEIQKVLDLYEKKMTSTAWVSLRKKTGFDLRRSIMEIEKLISYVGSKSIIDNSDIYEVVGKTKEDSVFDLTAALSEKNQLDALRALKALLGQGVHHLMILTMIVREIRLLLQAQILLNSGKLPKFNSSMDYSWFQKNIYPALKELATQHDLPKDFLISKHPFVIFNSLRNCVNFSYSLIIDCLDDLLEIDRRLKSSAPDPKLLLENFLIKACTN